MKNFLYVLVIILGIAASLAISTIWIELLIRFFFIPTENPINILVLGLDKDISGTRRTDVILIASVDLDKRKILLSSIPRDLIINGEKINSYYQKEGIDNFKKRIQNLTGIEIKRYLIVDYDIFQFLGDKLGPIEVFVDRPMHYKDVAQNLEINFSPGYYKMNGKQLLAYLRFRKTAEGDIGRLDKQRVIIEKLAQKALQKNVLSLTALYKEIRKRTQFNVDIGEMVYIYSKIRKGFTIDNINFPFYIGNDGNLYVDEAKINKYRESLKMGEKKIEESYRYYVVNNTSKRNANMLQLIEKAFENKGYKPNKIFYDGVDVDFKKNTVLILRKNEGLKLYVDKMIKTIFPGEEFDIVFVDDSVNYVAKYLSLIGELTRSGKQVVFPIDFIIILINDKTIFNQSNT
ncbi:MAG: LCP family protein [Fervidobacterium sp.]